MERTYRHWLDVPADVRYAVQRAYEEMLKTAPDGGKGVYAWQYVPEETKLAMGMAIILCAIRPRLNGIVTHLNDRVMI